MPQTRKRVCLEELAYLSILYLISSFVFLNGDDFMYATFAKEGIWQSVAGYYITGNGRFWINILDSLLLAFDRYVFLLINPLIILAFIVLMAKNMQWIVEQRSNRQKEAAYIRWGMALFVCLDVLCLRETIFWITGMMNYLFPAVVFLFAALLFQQLRSGEVTTVVKKAAFCLVCLFAGSSVEQYALMFVGVMTLLLGTDLLAKRKIPKVLLAGYICALAGLASLLLAPGNFVRIEAQKELVSFIDNSWTLVYQNTMSPVAFPFLLMLILCAGILLAKKAKIWRALIAVLVLAMLAINSIPAWEKAILMLLVLVAAIVVVCALFLGRKYSQKAEILSLVFVGLGSQVMLLVSAVWGFRCMLSMYMVYMLLILFCLPQMKEGERAFVLCSGILAGLHVYCLAVFWLVLVCLKNRENSRNRSCVLLGQAGAAAALVILLLGYAGNVSIHKENLNATRQGTESGVVTLHELPDDKYSWYFIPMGEFHEGYYKKCHELPESVEIVYVENEEVS